MSGVAGPSKGKGKGKKKAKAMGKTGKYGLSRGPGSAPMTWGNETKTNKSKFKTKTVQGEVVNPQGSNILKEQRRKAMNLKPGQASQPRGGAATGGEDLGTNRVKVSPRYRRVIKEYFKQD